MDSPEKLHRSFSRKLSRLSVLPKVVVDKSANAGKSSVLIIDFRIHESQRKEFLAKGEIPRLIYAAEDWTLGAVSYLNAKLSANVKVSFCEHFVFDPTAYALTYWPDEVCPAYRIALSTPTLAALYTPTMEVNSPKDAAVFLESILVHELAHCYGSMNHDKKFKATFSRLCEALNLKPIV